MGHYETDKIRAVFVALKLNKINDADVIEKLQSVANRSGYLKNLVRQDIKSSQCAQNKNGD